MYRSYINWSNAVMDEAKGKENGSVTTIGVGLLTVVVTVLFLPYFLYRTTVRKPILGLVIWICLAFVIFATVHNNTLLLIANLVVLAGLSYLAFRYLRGWRKRQMVAEQLRAFFADFYGDESTRRTIKVKRTEVAGSYRVDFVTPYGKEDKDLMNKLPAMASALKLVRYIDLDLDPEEGYVSILISYTDPLEEHLDSSKAHVLNLTDDELNDPGLWLKTGIYVDTEPMEQPLWLPELGAVRTKTAGGSGTGKSSIQKQKLLFACLSPHYEVVVCDGKGTEFGAFRPYVDFYADGTDPKQFWDFLRYIEQKLKEHQTLLNASLDSGADREYEAYNPVNEGKLLFVVWDELGATLSKLSMKERVEAEDRIFGFQSIARSLGIATNFSSQTFNSSILDTRTRDNTFDFSEGFKLGSFQESKFLGFTEHDEARPDLIKGKLLKSGRTSSAGQVALQGIGRNTYGKSYFLSSSQIRQALEEKGVRKDGQNEPG